MGISHCYVSLPEGTAIIQLDHHPLLGPSGSQEKGLEYCRARLLSGRKGQGVVSHGCQGKLAN